MVLGYLYCAVLGRVCVRGNRRCQINLQIIFSIQIDVPSHFIVKKKICQCSIIKYNKYIKAFYVYYTQTIGLRLLFYKIVIQIMFDSIKYFKF